MILEATMAPILVVTATAVSEVRKILAVVEGPLLFPVTTYRAAQHYVVLFCMYIKHTVKF